MYDLSPELEALFFRMQVVIGGKSALRWQTILADDKSFLSVFVINFIDAVRHRVFLVPKLSCSELQSSASRIAIIGRLCPESLQRV